MKTKVVLIIGAFFILLSCSSTKTFGSPEQIAALDQLVENQSFEIQSEWAFPFVTNSMVSVQNAGLLGAGNSANRISLLDIPNELKLKGTAISSELPYYGEVQMPTSYMSTDTNDIKFEGDISDYKVVKKKNNTYTISFDAKSHNEHFDVTITLYPNMKSEMLLRGAKRFPISYKGVVTPLIE